MEKQQREILKQRQFKTCVNNIKLASAVTWLPSLNKTLFVNNEQESCLRKILIFGNSGSGKSTLAKELAEINQLAHLDLDTLAWLPVLPPERAPLVDSERKIIEFTQLNDGWVVEGCYSDLVEIVGPIANEVIFMNPTIDQCVENAKRRSWEPHKYESKEAQDNNLAMLIDWIKGYTERDDSFSFKSHMALFEGFHGKKTMYIDNDRNT